VDRRGAAVGGQRDRADLAAGDQRGQRVGQLVQDRRREQERVQRVAGVGHRVDRGDRRGHRRAAA
jgi:hypothetical protein